MRRRKGGRGERGGGGRGRGERGEGYSPADGELKLMVFLADVPHRLEGDQDLTLTHQTAFFSFLLLVLFRREPRHEGEKCLDRKTF